MQSALRDETSDVVVNLLVWTQDQALRDVDLFARRTSQYVFISAASAYQKPPGRTMSQLRFGTRSESTRGRRSPVRRYLCGLTCEAGFPATIVRPSQTYEKTFVPFEGGWTVVDRMQRGKPVVVHGDGTSLWVLTHHEDCARALVCLLGTPALSGNRST